MLKTLENYIHPDDAPGDAFGWSIEWDRRFRRILSSSVIAHVVIIAITLAYAEIAVMEFPAQRDVELVTVTELAPPPSTTPLRQQPEQVEQDDISRLEFDPRRADDVTLVSKSPVQGNPSARERERRATNDPASNRPQDGDPPLTPPIQTRQAPETSQSPTDSQGERPSDLQPLRLPPSIAGMTRNNRRASRQRTPDGDSNPGTPGFSIDTVQSQYLALVRHKIRSTNEKLMPRGWIRDVLTDRVSADFSVILGPGGRILSISLRRSTGFATLDDTARQAIVIAAPFEGWPQEAGDRITLTVTVHYAPLW